MNRVSLKTTLAGLASLLIVLALMGHAAYHTLDIRHDHHKNRHQLSVSTENDRSSPNQAIAEVRDIPKCELFNLVTPTFYPIFLLERSSSVFVFHFEASSFGSQTPLVTRSRAPPLRPFAYLA